MTAQPRGDDALAGLRREQGGLRPILRDLVLAVVLVGALWLTVTPPGGRSWQFVLAGVGVVATVLRRFAPVPAVVVVALATAVAWVLGMTADPGVLLGLSFFTVAERYGRRLFPWWLVGLAVVVGLVLVGIGSDGVATGLRSLVLSVVVLSAAWALGTRTRQVRREAAARARDAERLRLAREVHDVLSHSLGTIGVQAGVAAHVATLDNDQLRHVLREVEADARSSLEDLRDLLRRERDDTERPPDLATGSFTDGPADALRRAGVDVAVEITGDPGGLPTAYGQTIRRIIQEATTNVIRHSGGTRCRISIHTGTTEVRISVADDGHGTTGTLREGHGLAGMRERIALLDGTFTAGNEDGGFVVTATLPVGADARLRR